jgi:hypothetical protein
LNGYHSPLKYSHDVSVVFYHLSEAEQWDLSKPIQTCGFQVERRNNDLYLLFTTENHSKLFALAKLHEENAAKSVEPVMDSSRYFVVQIQSAGKSAYIGFGFRDRDVALDLVGNLQQFQKSIQREQQAKNMKVAEIPKLAEGEKIHISFGSKKATDADKKKPRPSGGGPILLKKPPKLETTTVGMENATAEITQGVEQVTLEDKGTDPNTPAGDGDDEDDGWGDFEQA